MRTTILLAVAVVLAVVVFPHSSHAGGGPKDHTGFFLRLAGGGGYVSTGEEDQGVDVNFSGFAGDFTIAIGGCVSENLALHGTFFGWSLSNPDVELGSFSAEADGDLSMNGWGGGITYYVMPANVYLSGTLGAATLSASGDDFNDNTSDLGFAADFSVGKEWWVGNSWGLGLAGMFGFHTIEDATGYEVGLRFSATFN